MKTLRYLWQKHCWFVVASREYAGGWNARFPTQWFRAWVRFMWFSWQDRHFYLSALAACLLPSCAGDIAGLSRDERLTLYGTAATLAGKPEFAVIAYELRKPVTSAKQPKEVRP